jgi:hypothetical protein
MSEFIGDTSHLKRDTVPFSAVFTFVGDSGSGAVTLTDNTSISRLISGRAYVSLDPSSLTLELISPPSPDKAAHLTAAIIPSTVAKCPTLTEQILTIPGSVLIRSSTYDTTLPSAIQLAPGVAHQLVPAPLIGDPPKLVYSYHLAGASAETKGHARLRGTITVGGVGFIQTW